MSKYIILAKLENGGVNFIAGSSSRSMSHLLEEAAQFRNKTNAEIAANQLRQIGFERKHNVELYLAPLTMSYGVPEKLKIEKPKSGFVIQRQDGRYYKGAKTVAPKDFGDAHYKWGEIEAATFFPTLQLANTRAKQIAGVLKDTAKRMNDKVYADLSTNFKPTISRRGML